MPLLRELWATSATRTAVVALLVVLGAVGAAVGAAAAGPVLVDRSGTMFVVLAAALVAAVVSDLAIGLVMAGLSADWSARVRRSLCSVAFGQDLPTLESTPVGELLDRIDNDVYQVASELRGNGVRLAQAAAAAVASVVTMLVVWWPIGLGILVLTVLLAAGLARPTARMTPARIAEEEAWSDLAAVMEESIHGQDDIRTSLARPYVMKAYARAASTVLSRAGRVFEMAARITVIASGATRAAIAVIVLTGTWALVDGRVDGARLTTIWLLAISFGFTADQLARVVPELQYALGAWARIQLLRRSPQEPLGGAAPAAGDLEVRGLTFRYGSGDQPPALRDVSLRFERGRSYAVIGRTGSGKSTLAKVLTRAVQVPSGTVRLAGTDITDLAVDELRRFVAIVPQRTEILAGTLAENVALFDPDLRPGVDAAIQELGLTSWVAGLPDGVHTRLGEGGYTLSAGQEQLVAFARILVRDPHVVILDEATARLDPVTEGWVQRATDRLLQGRIGVIVAHRLSSVQRCDEVVVMADGAVLEAGPLRESRRFAELAATAVPGEAGASPSGKLRGTAGPGEAGSSPSGELRGTAGPGEAGSSPSGELRMDSPGGAGASPSGELRGVLLAERPGGGPGDSDDGAVPASDGAPTDHRDDRDGLVAAAPAVTDPPPLPPVPPAHTLREIVRLAVNDPRFGLAAVGLFAVLVLFGLDGAVLPVLWTTVVDGVGDPMLPAIGIAVALIVAIPTLYYTGRWFPEWWVRQMLRIGLRLVQGQIGPRRVSKYTPAEVVAQGGDTERVVMLADNVVDLAISAVLIVAMTVTSGSFVPAAFFLGTLVVSGLMATLFGPRLERAAARTVAARAAFATALVSSLSAARTVKLAGATGPVLDHLARLDGVRSEHQRREIAIQVWARSTPSVASGLLPIGAWALYLSGGMSAAATLVAVSVLGAARWFAWTAASLVSHFPSARVWTRRTVAMAGVAEYSSAVPGVDLSAGTAPAPEVTPREPLRSLELADFSAVHENGTVGVAGVDLTVERGELVLVTGPVGSGKSSLLRALAGIVHHTGSLRWNGRRVDEPEAFLRPNQVGYVAQLPRVLSGTVADNIALGHEVNTADAVTTAQLDHDLASAGGGLHLVIGHKGTRLSGGQLQRLALARALAPRTELLIADDVSSALDVTTELALWRALRERGVTVVGSTSKRAALVRADRVVVLAGGRVMAQGTWAELEGRWGHLAG